MTFNVSTSEFQKIWSNLIEYLRLENENTMQQNSDADAVMVGVHRALTTTALLAECTPM
jgi:hypothetical protein